MKISRETLREIMARRPSPKSVNWQAIATLKARIDALEVENAELRKWKQAVNEKLINCCIGVADDLGPEKALDLIGNWR